MLSTGPSPRSRPEPERRRTTARRPSCRSSGRPCGPACAGCSRPRPSPTSPRPLPRRSPTSPRSTAPTPRPAGPSATADRALSGRLRLDRPRPFRADWPPRGPRRAIAGSSRRSRSTPLRVVVCRRRRAVRGGPPSGGRWTGARRSSRRDRGGLIPPPGHSMRRSSVCGRRGGPRRPRPRRHAQPGEHAVGQEHQSPSGAEQPCGLGHPAGRAAPGCHAVLADDEVERPERERHELTGRLDEGEGSGPKAAWHRRAVASWSRLRSPPTTRAPRRAAWRPATPCRQPSSQTSGPTGPRGPRGSSRNLEQAPPDLVGRPPGVSPRRRCAPAHPAHSSRLWRSGSTASGDVHERHHRRWPVAGARRHPPPGRGGRWVHRCGAARPGGTDRTGDQLALAS